MSFVEITNVQRLAVDSETLFGFSIELPAAGTSQAVYCFDFAGWALGKTSKATQIELIANDGPVRTIPILFPRADVDSCFPTATPGSKVAFWSPVSVMGMTPEFEFEVQVVLANGVRTPIARICGRHAPLPSRFEATMEPLMVNSLGRTGTTWVMRVLAEHPEIVAVRAFPYETRPGKYWMQLLGAMAEPAYQAQSVSRLGTLDDEFWSTQDPFQRGAQDPRLHRWFNSRFVEQTAQLCQRSIEDCYREVARLQEQPNPKYFAEKHVPDEVPGIMWELYPGAKEIFVIRDPRDMLCSISAFNAKRGIVNFGRDQVSSDQEYVEYNGRVVQRFLAGWKSRRDRAHLLRYEDLILEPVDSLCSLLAYLGVQHDRARAEAMLQRATIDTPEQQAHRTAGNVRASIGRWRSELDEPIQALCQQVFAEALTEFGYGAGRLAHRF